MTNSIKFIALIICLIFMFSCTDNEPEVTAQTGLEGTWEVESLDFTIISSGVILTETITTNVVGKGVNMNYTLELEEGEWSTTGEYGVTLMIEVDGQTITSPAESYENVNGSGTYTTMEDDIILNRSIFEYEFNGISLTDEVGTQAAQYKINSDGQLVISQDIEITSSDLGITTTSSVTSQSVWNRK